MPRTLRKHAAEIDRIAQRLEPALRRAFLSAVNALRGRISLDAIAAAVARGATSTQILAQTGQLSLRGVTAVLDRAFREAGVSTARALSGALGIDATFSVVNPLAVQAAQQLGARLVTRVTAETQQAIRTLIARAIRDGIPPREAARLIKPLIGLTPAQAQSALRYRQALIADARQADQIARMSERYATKLLNRRALTIARQETLMAANRGQEQAWQQAVRDGWLDPFRTQRQWSTSHDERVCPLCGPMDGALTGLDQPWDTSEGPVMTPQEIHVQCRCSEVLAFEAGARTQQEKAA